MANSQRGISTSLIVISVIVIIVAIVGVLAYVSMTSHPTTSTTKTTTTITISQPKKIKVAYVTGGDETDQGWASIGLKSIQTVAQLYLFNSRKVVPIISCHCSILQQQYPITEVVCLSHYSVNADIRS